ncbi:MAG: hypothetical protein R3C19_19485 [Planctomycetaceae bacterium]
MARRNSDTSISLFPFLAVLVCTMGALILLLLVTTRRIRHQQIHAVVAVQADEDSAQHSLIPVEIPDDPVDDPNGLGVAALSDDDAEAEAHRAADEIAALRADIAEAEAEHLQLQTQFRSTKSEAAALESEIRDAGEHLRRLQQSSEDSDQLATRLQSLTALREREMTLQSQLHDSRKQLSTLRTALEEATETTQQAEQLLVRRESALVSLREHVREQQDRQASAGTDSTIIEFSNSTGTVREPVIVEITGDGLVFRPGEVRMTPQDLQGFPARDNPLLSGVLALHRLRSLSTNAINSEPYVLLLVRPEGTAGFYVAQRILKDAGIHFGYELVEADREINTGVASDDETRVLRESLLAALTRRQSLYAALQGTVRNLHDSAGAGSGGNAWMAEDEPQQRGQREGNDALAGRYYAGGHAPERPPVVARAIDRPPLPSRELDDHAVGSFRDARPRGRVAPQPETAFQPFPEPAFGNPRNTRGKVRLDDTLTAEKPAGTDPGDVDPGAGVPGDHQRGADDSGAGERLTGPMREFDSVFGTHGDDAVVANGAAQNSDSEFWNNLKPIDDETSTTGETIGEPGDSADTAPADSPLRRRDSRAPSGWSGSFAAGDIQTSRTAGPAGIGGDQQSPATPSYAPPMTWHSDADSSVTGSEQSPGSAGSAFNANGVAVPFSMSVQGSPSAVPQDIDPEFLKMLAQAQHAAARSTLSRQVVTLFLDPGYVTVASQTPQRVSEDDFEEQLLAALRGVSEELKYAPRHGQSVVLPFVRFVVSPGAELTHLRLKRRLSELGIPSVSYIDLSPHVEPNHGRSLYSHEQPQSEAYSTLNDDAPGMPVIRPADPNQKRRIRL